MTEFWWSMSECTSNNILNMDLTEKHVLNYILYLSKM